MKNDGAKFFEMMEQLAERRMLREEMAIQGIEEDDLEDEDDLDDGEEEEDAEWVSRRASRLVACQTDPILLQ